MSRGNKLTMINMSDWKLLTIAYYDNFITCNRLSMERQLRWIRSDMIWAAWISKPAIAMLHLRWVSHHWSQLSRCMPPLICKVHSMVTIKGWITTLSIDLTRWPIGLRLVWRSLWLRMLPWIRIIARIAKSSIVVVEAIMIMEITLATSSSLIRIPTPSASLIRKTLILRMKINIHSHWRRSNTIKPLLDYSLLSIK